MDFWKIVGIVLLICAVSGLSVLFRELREDRKKQAEEMKKTGEKEKRYVKIATPTRSASIFPKSGSCGEKLTWRLKGDTLYIEGTGDMYLYRTNTWFPRDDRIHRAVIAPGCTGIGNAAFEGCTGLTSVEIPNTVTVIRWSAFRGCKALKELVIPDSVREIGKDAFKDVPRIRYGGPVRSDDHWGAKPWSGESKPGVQVQQEKTPTEEKKQLPDAPFTLEFHFKNRRESDLQEINNVLARYELQNVEFVERRGYLATETTTQMETGEKQIRYWYGLDDCILRCTPAKPGEGQVFQISTMTAEKNVEDCALLWRENNPGRQLRYKIFLVYEQVYALILLHHEQKPGAVEREIIPRSTKPKPAPCTGNMTWWREGDTLYVEGQGEIRSFGFAKDQTLRKVVIGAGCTRIGFAAFEDCTGLTGITIPESVRSIGNSAFSGCSSLTDIVLPNSIMEIGNGLFSRCTSLTSITIPDNVTLISGNAFQGCRGLTSITIPDKAWRISWGAFNGCSGLTSIRLPESIREIGRDAFCGCSSLTSIQLPEGVIRIEDCAFNGCSSLTSIRLPDGIREIGYGTFSGCSGLTKIQIPDSVTKIGRSAFAGCIGLTSLTVPGSVTKIGSDAFYEVPHIQCSGPLYAKDHWGAKDGTYEIANRFCGRPGKDSLFWHVDDDTLYIEGQGRLRCSGNYWDADGIRHVVIASGCTAIADHVFQGHRSLETVVFPDTLRTIGERAFSGCRKLREAEIPDSVTGIGKGAFDDCSGLKRVHLPRNLTQIHDKTFCDCRSLENVQIPDSVYYIGRSAFDSVKSINNLPRSLGQNCWYRHNGIRWEQPSGIGECAFAYVGQIKDCRIPYGVREIPENAFRWCGFTSVEIPDSVRKIGREAFSGCTKLISLTVPDHVTEIGAYAFSAVPHIIYNGPAESDNNWGAKQWSKQKCGKNLTWRQERGKLYIEGQGEIARNAFCSNDSIVEVVIAPGCTGIGEGAFSGCENLVSVELPEGMERIGKEAFRECTNLEDMDLPEGLKKIGESAFHKCKDLMLAIPDSVIEIGDSAFLDIPEIIYHGPCKSENNWGAVSLQTGLKGTCLCGNWRIQDKTLYLHVTGKLPWEMGEEPSWFPYVSAHNDGLHRYPESLRAEHVVIAPGCTEICGGAFMLTWIKTISIPDTVTVIGTSAFSQSDLQSVIIPDSVTAIGRNAFLDVPHIIYNGPAQSEDNWGALSRNG